MLMTPCIHEIPTKRDTLFAFRITGMVAAADMEAMSKRMLEAFDQFEEVDMLLKFEAFEGSEFGSNFSWPAVKAKAKSVTNVGKYVVVGAPEEAQTMIDIMGKLIPVEAKTYGLEDETQAWAAVGESQ